MSCLTETRRAQLQAQLDKLNIALDAIDEAIANNSLVIHVESASLDTGEGKQAMKYRSMDDLINTREKIQSQVDRLINLLNGTGLVNFNLRRKNGANESRWPT
jgi:hypothetical protein